MEDDVAGINCQALGGGVQGGACGAGGGRGGRGPVRAGGASGKAVQAEPIKTVLKGPGSKS